MVAVGDAPQEVAVALLLPLGSRLDLPAAVETPAWACHHLCHACLEGELGEAGGGGAEIDWHSPVVVMKLGPGFDVLGGP